MKNATIVIAVAFGLASTLACQTHEPAPATQPGPTGDAPDAEGTNPDTRRAGAVVTLESEEESGGHFTDMVDMLRGRVSGLQVVELANGNISLRIRGLATSFMANQEPLLVVDGLRVPTYAITNTLRTIDPREVRSIQVLKDVASTSAYGARGVNGVIVIRLKKPGGAAHDRAPSTYGVTPAGPDA
jgi:TonB-dependent SusC/RagA subfamily outer membrane receptor